MASESLNFNILAKDSASRVFDRVGKSASDTEGRFDKVNRGLMAVGKVAARGAVLFGGLGAAGAIMGLKTAAGMEQARISFTTMLGSATKADKFLKQLADFAAKTPFEFPELQTAASSLISAGFHAKQVIPIMTTLGDVTSGMGTGSEGIKRATVALQQMSAAGKITGEDLNQLRDAGVPVFDLLSAATGKSKAAIAALAQQGKLGKTEMQALFDALGTGKGLERFDGLMEKQSQSLTGMWSTFKDTLGMGLAKAIEPAIPAIKAGLEKLTGIIGATLAALPEVVGRIKDFAGPIVQKIRDAVPVIIAAVGQWRDAVSNFLTGVVVKVTPLITAIQGALNTGDWGPVGAALGGALAKAVEGAGAAIGKLTAAFGSFMARVDWVGIGIAIGRQAPALLIGLATGLLNFDLMGLLKGLAAHWQEVLIAIIAVAFTPARIIGKVAEVLARIPLVGRLLAWALEHFAAFSKGLVDMVGRALGSMGGAFLSGFRRVFPQAGEGLAEGLALLPLRIAVAAIDLAQAGVRMMGRLRDAIVGRIESVVAGFGEIVGRLVKAAGGFAGQMVEVGANLVRGFITGIKNMAGAALQAAKDMAASAVNAVKDHLKIFSPSKVMIELGEFFAEGMAVGIKNGTAVALDATKALIDKVTTKLDDLRSKAQSIRSTAANAVRGALDVGGLGATTTGTDADGNPTSTTASVTSQVGSFAQSAQQFSAAISAAIAKGVNPNLVSQIANLGPQNGLVAAQAVAAMSAAEVSQTNASLALADKFAAKVGQTILTTTSLPGDIARQEGVLTTLKAIKADLASGRTIHFTINDATDPDAVVAAIRRYIKKNGLLRNVTA